jgi:hypothetical protein
VKHPIIEAEITFLKPRVLNHPDARYRPHVTLNLYDDPYAIPGPERLGVEFSSQSPDVTPGLSTVLSFYPLFPGLEYSGMSAGAEFRLLEGPTVVATGRVLRVTAPPSSDLSLEG